MECGLRNLLQLTDRQVTSFTEPCLKNRTTKKPGNSRALYTLKMTDNVLCIRRDSNPQPTEPESAILSIELRMRAAKVGFLADKIQPAHQFH